MTFNDLIELANSLGARWVTWMLAALLDTTAILILVSLIWAVIRNRAAPQVGYLLFLLVPLKLLIPGSVPAPKSIANWTPSVVAAHWIEHRGTQIPPQQPMNDFASPLRKAVEQAPPELSSLASSPNTAPATLPKRLPTSATANLAHMPDRDLEVTPAPASRPSHSTLTSSALLMLVWIASVAVLVTFFVVSQRGLSRLVARLRRTVSTATDRSLDELGGRLGLRTHAPILFSPDVTTPAVSGLIRPTVMMPTIVLKLLTPAQLEWVLLHELAHVQRRDLWVIALQRLVNMVHFFNPAIWFANRMIHRLREFACDDLASAFGRGTAVDSSEAFVLMLRHSQQSSRLDGALGIFGMDSREACFARVQRLLNTDRTIPRRVGWISRCGFVLLALIVLPHLSAVNSADETAKVDRQIDEAIAKETGKFELTVLGPDHQLLSGISVNFEIRPVPTPDKIREGQYLKKNGDYGTSIATSKEGRIEFDIPANQGRTRVTIKSPGYEPYSTSWSAENPSQQLPAKFEIQLDSAWTVGGVVLDPDGKPLPGVEISPNLAFKRRKGDPNELYTGTRIKTDEMGKWQFASVPQSISKIGIALNHPRCAPLFQSLTREDFELTPTRTSLPVIRLERGLTVRGRVTDPEGLPVIGARVFTQFSNDMRETTTDTDGSYELNGCLPLVTKIVVAAKGHAREIVSQRVDPEMEPVDFVLKPGGHVRIRVLDKDGNPAPKSRIFFQRWRGDFFGYFEFDGVNQYTDENGVWEWNEAPLDEFQADICPKVGMQLPRQRLIAREEEYVFRPPVELEISGRVLDVETGKPVPSFDVIPGGLFSEGHPFWNHKNRFTARTGTYKLRPEQGRAGYLFRIEASGYRTAVSRIIQPTEGPILINFSLTPVADLVTTVMSPAGTPAGGARVALGIAGTQIDLHNGDFRDRQTYCAIQTADELGKLRVAPQDQAFDLIVLHVTGFAHLRVAPEMTLPNPLSLQAWARVEGQFRIGNEIAPNVPLEIERVGIDTDRKVGPSMINSCRAVTDSKGRFVFDRVFPGQGTIGREIVMNVEQGATSFTSSARMPFDFESGQLAQVQLGGLGRPVIGRLHDPNNPNKDWKQVLVDIYPPLPELPPLNFPELPPAVAKDPVQRKKWMQEWQLTDEGRAWTALQAAHQANETLRSSMPRYRATMNVKGEFRFEDIPEGDYVIEQLFSNANRKFSIPAMPDGRSDEPLDLGTLELGK